MSLLTTPDVCKETTFVVERIQRTFCFLFVFQVTCPGTFLRDYGYVYLKVNCMGLEVNTKSVAPTFPLFFHERLRFERVSYMQNMTFNLSISSRTFSPEFTRFQKFTVCFVSFNTKVFKSCQDPAYVTVHLKGKQTSSESGDVV